MQRSVINTTPPPTYPEIFFVEKCLELLYHGTIESYRLQLHNPRTLLEEVINVTKSLSLEEITNDEHVRLVASELHDSLDKPTYLKFESVSEAQLKGVTKAQKSVNYVSDIFYSANLVLHDNIDYLQRLVDAIAAEILRLNNLTVLTAPNLAELSRMASYFLIELRQAGYSKRYLHKFISQIFFKRANTTFQDRFQIISSLVTRPVEAYQVVVGFKLSAGIGAQLQILDPVLEKLDSPAIGALVHATNQKVRKFFSDNPDLVFYKVSVNAKDYYQASYHVRRELQLALDVLFMGYNNNDFNIHQACVVIGNHRPNQASVQNLDFHLDGHFRSDQALYSTFAGNISQMKARNTSPDAVSKIEAALRYLRSGSEAHEIENKLLNYWIAVEYFFSSTDARHSKVLRARDFLKKISGRTYFKRLLIDFHESIKFYGATGHIATFSDDLLYLRDLTNYDTIAAQVNIPALAFRAFELKERIKSQKVIKIGLKSHADKLERNLMRIYRHRNAIVHSAASGADLLDVTSHLKYYLVFVINSAIDFINNTPVDLNMDGRITLDDFFAVCHIEYENLLISDGLDISTLFKYKHPLEYLT